jgi:hypothetical protein
LGADPFGAGGSPFTSTQLPQEYRIPGTQPAVEQNLPYGSLEPVTQAPAAQAQTNADKAERYTDDKIQQNNQDLDAAYKYLKDHFAVDGPGGDGFTDKTIAAALNLPAENTTGQEKRGFQALHDNFSKIALYGSSYTRLLGASDVTRFEQEQAAAQWVQAAQKYGDLGNELRNVNHVWSTDAPHVNNLGHWQIMSKGDLDKALADPNKSATDRQAIEFMQRHYNELVSSDPNNDGITGTEINSWTNF